MALGGVDTGEISIFFYDRIVNFYDLIALLRSNTS